MDIANQVRFSKHEGRLQRIWLFLSKERARNFYTEMWVPVENPQRFQAGLKACIVEANDEAGWEPPGKLISLVQSWIHTNLSASERALLALWAQAIYVGDGPDRLGEFLWSSLVAMLANQPDEFRLGRTHEALREVHRIKVKQCEALRNSLQRLGTPTDSERWLRAPDEVTELDHVADLISNISSHNVFAAAWERYCGCLDLNQLFLLYEAGANLAVRREMTTQGLPFPGSWQFELRPFLDRHAGDS